MVLPLVASADQSGSCGDNVTYTYVEATNTLTISGRGAMTNCTDPYCFPWISYGLKTVIIENGVTSIGSYAFGYHSSLIDVTIPNSVTSIGEGAFDSCRGLTSVTIPNSVTSIGNYAFSGCSGLTSVTIPNSVTSIGKSAFSGCRGLTSVDIPNSVTSIGDGAFDECYGLSSISIPNSVTCIGSFAFGRTDWYINQPDGLLYLDNWLLGWKGTKPSGEVVIKEGTKGIADRLFYGCNFLTSVTIPNSVTCIGNFAFYECSDLTSITIPNSVTRIGDYAFDNCRSLSSIIIPNSVASIGNWAFKGCSNLSSVTIGNSVMSIGNYAFWDCLDLTSITIPNSVTSIGENAFSGTRWYNKQSYGLLYLDNWLLGWKGTMPSGELVIKEGTKGIAGNAFKYCSSLASVTIPNSVTSIGMDVFEGCSKIKAVYSKIKKPFNIRYAFQRLPDDATLYVPVGTKTKYEATEGWNIFKKIAESDELSAIEGDLNGDDEIDVTDVVELIDMVLAGIYDPAGDINGDGEVDVTDVVELIDMVLSGE